jgi:hypothetical protein
VLKHRLHAGVDTLVEFGAVAAKEDAGWLRDR